MLQAGVILSWTWQNSRLEKIITKKFILNLAPNEVRTRDLTLTKRMLCQLSYEGITETSNP